MTNPEQVMTILPCNVAVGAPHPMQSALFLGLFRLLVGGAAGAWPQRVLQRGEQVPAFIIFNTELPFLRRAQLFPGSTHQTDELQENMRHDKELCSIN